MHLYILKQKTCLAKSINNKKGGDNKRNLTKPKLQQKFENNNKTYSIILAENCELILRNLLSKHLTKKKHTHYYSLS